MAAVMGGAGRATDGGCALLTRVPAAQVVPFSSDLDRATLGAHTAFEAGRSSGKLVVTT